MKRFFPFILFSLVALPALHGAPVALFYMTNSPDSIRSFLAHSSHELRRPLVRSRRNSLVTGAPEPTVLKRAQEQHVPVMPIIALFDKKKFHTFVTTTNAWAQ